MKNFEKLYPTIVVRNGKIYGNTDHTADIFA